MGERYVPQVTEAAVPEDGSWAKLGGKDVLMLRIPGWEEVARRPSRQAARVWMYDKREDAYIFCFRLQDGTERAVAFAKDHAGRLLTDERAYGFFSILITPAELGELSPTTPMILFQDLFLKRHPKAGW
ncbi:MAG: hypothetical protein M0Z65_12720 [Firmicutes bacterium]|uniref:Uncharacterized protein n=1 Tax=Melghirimyces thermohalophilus TaxID=1236220 RepID=A0A1G6I7B4_9BACL|nr:hypothetical protein [Melghirimyces thermohalophilus]MDA8354009.1 hypothetical protein [Bacillota bacterium]SDC02427.1 hypothetical protein SAMN04488112_10297 [Melghirimyces thermohalophilus]